MAGIRAVVAGGALALPAVLAAAGPALAADQPGDADVVYCLSTAQRAPLADAAVALGLATPATTPGDLTVDGTAITVQRWREAHPAEFARACTALAAAREPAAGIGDPGGSGWLDLAQVALGALLTWVTAVLGGWWRDVATSRGTLADDLSAAIRELRVTAERFLGSTASPADQAPARAAVQQARNDAVRAARHIVTVYPRQPQPRALHDLLDAPEFGAEFTPGGALSADERAARGGHVRRRLAQAELLTDGITAALKRRARPWARATGDPQQPAPTTPAPTTPGTAGPATA